MALLMISVACSGPTREVRILDPLSCDPPAFPSMPMLASIKAEGGAVCMTPPDADALTDWARRVKRWRVRYEAQCGPLPAGDELLEGDDAELEDGRTE